ncbi:MAG: FecR domain-containing protein [Planctomycetes bacterium]|nr:FecR domain-containing protein [Planctomycetota bacterium]
MREVTRRWWRKAQQRAAVPLAAAAALLLAIGYLSLPSRPTSAIAPLQVARVLSHSPAFDGTPLRRISSEFGQPTPVVPGAGIHTAELLVSDVGALTVMEMPEVGLLHLAGAAHCRFAGPRHLLLEDGDLEANILPRGREFTIETPAGVVTVLGTRFRVRASRFGTVITVSHGKVRFANAHGTVAVGAAARSAATPETAPSRPVEVDPLAPLGEAERAVLWRDPRLALDFAAASCLPGTPLAARIHVTSPNPVTWLQPLTDAASYYLLNVTRPDGASFQVRLNAFHPTELSANRRAKGRVLLGQDQSYDVECTLADIFTSPGKYQLSASYTESRAAGEAGDAWRGILTSAPVTIDVADHP